MGFMEPCEEEFEFVNKVTGGRIPTPVYLLL